jgi:ATPase, P-type (transporting), HAD superfamily, subfamily IC
VAYGKGGKPLEDLGSLTAIAFDKTGTLTEGKPTLTGIYAFNNCSEASLLEIIVAVEQLSDHPLAAAIVRDGKEKLKKEIAPATSLQAIGGRGVKAIYNNKPVLIGNKELFTDKGQHIPEDIISKAVSLESGGNTTMLVQLDNVFIGIIALMDVARPEAKATIAQLRRIGIRKMIMLTGDNQQVAEAIAKEIGLTDAWGNLLPEQKLAAIEKLKAAEQKLLW